MKATGTITSVNDAVTLELDDGYSHDLAFQFTGDFGTGNLLVEVSLDESNWVTLQVRLADGTAAQTTVAAVGVYRPEAPAIRAAVKVRARVTTATNGVAATLIGKRAAA